MKLFQMLKIFIEDWIVFFQATRLLLKANPWEEEDRAEAERAKQILKEITAEYRADIEQDHEPDEVEEQMLCKGPDLRRKAKVLAHNFGPSKVTETLNRFHDAKPRYFWYLVAVWVGIFGFATIRTVVMLVRHGVTS